MSQEFDDDRNKLDQRHPASESYGFGEHDYNMPAKQSADEQITELQSTIASLEKRVKELEKYAEHLAWCATGEGPDRKCTCGLHESLTNSKEAK